MTRRSLLARLPALVAALVTPWTIARTAYAADRKYKCVRSGRIYTYDKPGNYKCPEHSDHNLIPVK